MLVTDIDPIKGYGSFNNARLNRDAYGAGPASFVDFSRFFICKLEAFGPLPASDKDLLRELTRTASLVPPGSEIIREGDRPNDVNLLASGFGFRFKWLSDGRRQIVGFLMPGDLCNLNVAILEARVDHGISTLMEVQLVKISRDNITRLLERTAIARALQKANLIEEATSRDWITNIGSRPAEKRLAHFLCEWHSRLDARGLAQKDVCDFPLTQVQLAETVGLSPVHVNRALRKLRENHLIALNARRLNIVQVERLRALGDFDGSYLDAFSK